jgi:hypothetical protein
MLFVTVRVVVWAFAFFAIVEHAPSHAFVGSKGHVQGSSPTVVPGDVTCGACIGKDHLVSVAHVGIRICDDNHNSNSSNSIEYKYIRPRRIQTQYHFPSSVRRLVLPNPRNFRSCKFPSYSPTLLPWLLDSLCSSVCQCRTYQILEWESADRDLSHLLDEHRLYIITTWHS